MTARVSPTLVDLAAVRATGALSRDTGILYLADGHVVHAESPATPSIDTLLVACGRIAAEGWQKAVEQAAIQHAVGRFLVCSGQLTDGELEICHLSTLFDAAFFALSPEGGPTRFRAGARHWFGTVRAVPAEAVAQESRRRRLLLDSVWPFPQVDAAPLVRRPTADARRVSRRQRAVLDLADGVRTPLVIARLLGRPAFHTLVDVRRLAAAGHLETPSAPAPPPRPAHPPHPVAAASAEADLALLRRLRDALEARL